MASETLTIVYRPMNETLKWFVLLALRFVVVTVAFIELMETLRGHPAF